jgi:Surface antigen variable number repeat
MNWQFYFFPGAAAARPLKSIAHTGSGLVARAFACNSDNRNGFVDRAFRCDISYTMRHRALVPEAPGDASFAPACKLAAALTGALLLALSAFAAPAARGARQATAPTQNGEGSAKLASIEATGSKRFTSAQIAASTGLHVGSQVTRADLQQAANVLAQLGAFASVQYRFGSEASGVDVQFQVTDAPSVPVFFDNFPWFTDDQLAAALKSAVPLFDGSAPEHGTILDSMANALGTFLVAHGLQGSVSHVLTSTVFGDQEVQEFKADDAGVDIASVNFSDPFAGSDRGIRTRLSDLIGQPYSRTAIELFEFEQVRPVYLSHAYVRVKFDSPRPQFVARSNNARVAVDVQIEPGAMYTWGGVTWSGASALDPPELGALVQLKPGDPANGLKIEATWQAVREGFAEFGYLDVHLTPTPQYDDSAKRVSYLVSIDQGTQYRMGQLVLSGLSVEGERRIRDAWKIGPGEVFDESTYDEFLSKGIDQAFAGFPAHYDKIGRYLQKNPKTGTVDVMLDFE